MSDGGLVIHTLKAAGRMGARKSLEFPDEVGSSE